MKCNKNITFTLKQGLRHKFTWHFPQQNRGSSATPIELQIKQFWGAPLWSSGEWNFVALFASCDIGKFLVGTIPCLNTFLLGADFWFPYTVLLSFHFSALWKNVHNTYYVTLLKSQLMTKYWFGRWSSVIFL